MKNTTDTSLKLRNLAFWIVAAVTYPVAHWIPTSSGHPPRIFDVLIPICIMALGFASTIMLGTALKKDGEQ
jgi:uncharacterized membrane protein (DUF4010 family)